MIKMSDDEYYEDNGEESSEELLDGDEMSVEEEGFLKGYDEEAESDNEFDIDSDPDEE